MTTLLKAPFPWFGGKSRAAHLVWRGFGDVPNYVEPFFGSGAVLLARPHDARIETVNDRDMYLANFWRAAQQDPDGVAFYADWPVNEVDLHARHRWLVKQHGFRERMRHDPEFFDVRVAGWWCWGICMWIGGGFCAESNWDAAVHRSRGTNTAAEERRPTLLASMGVHSNAAHTAVYEGRSNAGRAARGVHLAAKRERDLANAAQWEKRPSLDRGRRGVTSAEIREQLPMLSGDSGASGRGIHASALHDKMPMLSGAHGHANRGVHASGESCGPVVAWMRALAERLRRVRVCCGDWSRVLGRSVTENIGVTAVFFDPPYSAAADRDPSLYATEDLYVAHDVRAWCLENGSNPKLRIALCGYDGEHEMPKSWQVHPVEGRRRLRRERWQHREQQARAHLVLPSVQARHDRARRRVHAAAAVRSRHVNDHGFTDAERAHFRRLKFRAWFGRNRMPATPKHQAPRLANAPQGSPPSPSDGRRLFTKDTAQEEFWFLVPQLGCAVVVPGGALISGGQRAWRCEAVGTP